MVKRDSSARREEARVRNSRKATIYRTLKGQKVVERVLGVCETVA